MYHLKLENKEIDLLFEEAVLETLRLHETIISIISKTFFDNIQYEIKTI